MATKKTEEAELTELETVNVPDYSTWNIFQKINELRVRVLAANIKKSGYNGFANFHYFELDDFLPVVLPICNELGLFPQKGKMDAIIDRETGVELVPAKHTLTIFNVHKPDDKPVVFTNWRASAEQKGQLPIQGNGSENSYNRRYLWIDCLELTESDIVDATIGSKNSEPAEKKERLISPAQMKIIQSSGIDIQAMLQYFNVPDIGKLTAAQASEVIARKRLGDNEVK